MSFTTSARWLIPRTSNSLDRVAGISDLLSCRASALDGLAAHLGHDIDFGAAGVARHRNLDDALGHIVVLEPERLREDSVGHIQERDVRELEERLVGEVFLQRRERPVLHPPVRKDELVDVGEDGPLLSREQVRDRPMRDGRDLLIRYTGGACTLAVLREHELAPRGEARADKREL